MSPRINRDVIVQRRLPKIILTRIFCYGLIEIFLQNSIECCTAEWKVTLREPARVVYREQYMHTL